MAADLATRFLNIKQSIIDHNPQEAKTACNDGVAQCAKAYTEFETKKDEIIAQFGASTLFDDLENLINNYLSAP